MRSARGYRRLGQVDAFPLFWPWWEDAEHPRLLEAQGLPTSAWEAERQCWPFGQLHTQEEPDRDEFHPHLMMKPQKTL